MHRLALPTLVLALLLPVAVAVGPAHAGGAVMPPLEIELGRSAIAVGDGTDAGATAMLLGVSLASAYPSRLRVDVSAGWVGSFVADPAPGATARTGANDEPAWRPHDASGAFVALELRAAEGPHWRAWLGGRGELLGTEDVGVLGGFGRASIELWRPVAAGGGGGVVLGTVALAAWMEVGVRERPDRSLARIASAGLGLRVPLMAAR